MTNPDGSLSKLEVFRDITERKRVEEAMGIKDTAFFTLPLRGKSGR